MKSALKYIAIFSLLAAVAIAIYFSTMKKMHQELVKSRILYALNLVDSDWKREMKGDTLIMTTPTFLISDIYRSMEGPKADEFITIDPTSDELIYLTSFKTEAYLDDEIQRIANDFVCHTNFEYRDLEHFKPWGFNNRIGINYPRITSISNGVESFELPEGFGFPVMANERLFLNAQALNHNLSDSTFRIKHKIKIGFVREGQKQMQAVRPQTIFMMFPFDPENPFKGPTEQLPNACIPVDTKTHTYYDDAGNPLSGHWIVQPGIQEYAYDATSQLATSDSLRLHQITAHLHPFAESFKLVDKTTSNVIYDCNVTNYNNKIGLAATPTFQSQEGVWLYPDHQYELQLRVNNTSGKDQEMMASMAMFFADSEMDSKIKALHASSKP